MKKKIERSHIIIRTAIETFCGLNFLYSLVIWVQYLGMELEIWGLILSFQLMSARYERHCCSLLEFLNIAGSE